MPGRVSRTRGMVLLGIVPCVTLLVAAPQLFSIVLGERWREAGVYTQILAIMYLAQLVAPTLTPVLSVCERQDLQLARDLLRVVLVLGGFGAAAVFDLGARTAMAVYGAAMFVSYVVLLAAVVHVSRTIARAPVATEGHEGASSGG